MTTFQSALISYRPRPYPGEWLTAGVIGLDAGRRDLVFRSTYSYARFSAAFGTATVIGLEQSLSQLRRVVGEVRPSLANLAIAGSSANLSLSDIAPRILPPNDTSLQLGSITTAIGPPRGYESLDDYLDDLIEQIMPPSEPTIDTVAQMSGWVQEIRSYLPTGVRQRFASDFVIKAAVFPYGMKNGRYHLVQPLDLDVPPQVAEQVTDEFLDRCRTLSVLDDAEQATIYAPLRLHRGQHVPKALKRQTAIYTKSDSLEVKLYSRSELSALKADLSNIV